MHLTRPSPLGIRNTSWVSSKSYLSMVTPPSRHSSTCPSCLRDQVVPSALDLLPTKAFSMNNHSRSAAREGFAHQRARLLFSQRPNIYPSTARTPNLEPKRQRDIVRNGLIGFIPSGRQ